MRPVDIARKLQVSTTMLRNYEELGVIPPVQRTVAGYRRFTEEHVAYFTCIREMQKGFSFSFISQVMKLLLKNNINEARWLITESQAKLCDEMNIVNKVQSLLTEKTSSVIHKESFTIHEASLQTGIPISTIRYWDAQGLLNIYRTPHNYRRFTEQDIKRLLILYALKLSKYFKGNRHSISWMKEILEQSYTDNRTILELTNKVTRHLQAINALQQDGILAFLELVKQIEAQKHAASAIREK